VLAAHDHTYCCRSHAEVLARRALQCFLLDEIEREIAGFKTKTSSSMFQLDEAGVLTLRPGVTLHMYTSSQPCGNASLKRWAKGKTPVYQGLGPMDVPEQSHPRLHMPPQALSEGMVRAWRFHLYCAPPPRPLNPAACVPFHT
jgi:hypothetical protein